MVSDLSSQLTQMLIAGFEIAIYVQGYSEGPDIIASGFIFNIGDDFVALGRTPKIYTWVVPFDKIVMIEIVGTLKGM
ncbi:MAG: hypothetical protein E3J86_12390 [Candidatus Thorarchaeota archaeon]|nr:MAG: hypothetical protein E3J86_12390 [Candidatus Thorarchaeota archaeon]